MQLGAADFANGNTVPTAAPNEDTLSRDPSTGAQTDTSNDNLNASKRRIILAGKVFDPFEERFLYDQAVTIDQDRGIILDIEPTSAWYSGRSTREAQDNQEMNPSTFPPTVKIESLADEEVIDLRHLTILPGFVDAHVHLFLHSYAETSWNDQLTKESLPERTVRASVHARKTLQAGYTTVRDLGTEGAEDADVALRKCMAWPASGNPPLIAGPRYYCANRAIVPTGSYGPKSSLYPSQDGIEGVVGAEPADGVDACIRAVRRQIGAGADWIKIYGDYRFRSRMADVDDGISSRSLNNFNDAELKAMIDTAHSLGVKVAVHANSAEVLDRLLDLGPDSIEHGGTFFTGPRGQELVEKWIRCERTITWVPTLSIYWFFSQLDKGNIRALETWESMKEGFEKVLKANGVTGHGNKGDDGEMAAPGSIPIACGGDTGAFPHGENALELALMRRLGAPWSKVLTWATLGGWNCVRGMEWEGPGGQKRLDAVGDVSGATSGSSSRDRRPSGGFALERNVPFGAIRKGWTADVVGVAGRLDGNADDFQESICNGVQFVMKGGLIYRSNGLELAQSM